MGGPGSGPRKGGTSSFSKNVNGKTVGKHGQFRKSKGTTFKSRRDSVKKNTVAARKHYSPKKY